MRKSRLNITLDNDLVDYARTMARACGMTVSGYVEGLIVRDRAARAGEYEQVLRLRGALDAIEGD